MPAAVVEAQLQEGSRGQRAPSFTYQFWVAVTAGTITSKSAGSWASCAVSLSLAESQAARLPARVLLLVSGDALTEVALAKADGRGSVRRCLPACLPGGCFRLCPGC